MEGTKVKVIVKGFTLTTTDADGEVVKMDIPNSGYAEQILRGMVHSGMVVTIAETTEVKLIGREEAVDLQLKGFSIINYRECEPYFLREDCYPEKKACLTEAVHVPQYIDDIQSCNVNPIGGECRG